MIDPSAAITRALGTTSMPGAGLCLRFVDESYGTPTSRLRSGSGNPNAPADGNWLNAQDGWWYSTEQHPGDATDAPAGVPIYYSQMTGGDPAGHIALSLGGGLCRTTTGVRVITQSIASLNAERRSPNGGSSVLGWTSNYGNNPITGITDTPQEDTLSAAEVAELKAHIDMRAKQIYQLVRNDPTIIIDGRTGTGEISLMAPGTWEPIENPDYVKLLEARGVVQPGILNLSWNEYEYLRYKTLSPERNDEQIKRIVSDFALSLGK